MFARTGTRWFSVIAAGALATLFNFGASANAAEGDDASAAPSVRPATELLSEQQLAALIDAEIEAGWQRAGVAPADPCDDAEFLRRVSLDLSGRIPSISDARQFLDDPEPDKRALLVSRLLNHAGFAAHFANVWRELLLPGANNNAETRALVPPLEAWLRLRFAEKAPYDRLVTEVLTTRVDVPAGNNLAVNPAPIAPTPAAFFFANQRKPESLAASTARLFLGVQLQCAECHDHPFADWKQEEFWNLAAFFRDVAAPPTDDDGAPLPARRMQDASEGIEIPGTGRRVPAVYLRDGRDVAAGENQRVLLARWIASGENAYFARATVNRVWAHFLGYGLIEPIDDVTPVNPPSHPDALERLVEQFIAHRFELGYLIKAITSTRAYQLTSAVPESGDADPQLFARMPVRTLSAEQLFDSLVEATGYRPARAPAGMAALLGEGSARSQFVARFGGVNERTAEGESSILLALAMMNGDLVGAATSLEESETLAAVADAPFFDTPARVETLFLAALARRPSPHEASRFCAYVDSKTGVDENGDGKADESKTEKERRAALADIFWALLNSSEFQLNH